MKIPTILMLGWEFPPFNSGGLGVACEGLSKGLWKKGAQVIFVLPKKINCVSSYCRFVFSSDKEIKDYKNFIGAYVASEVFRDLAQKIGGSLYGFGLLEEVVLYAKSIIPIARRENFDVIHAHDWLCYPAGMEAKKASGKPLVVHVHATEFDRTGGNGVNQMVYEIEKAGMEMADKVMAVSNFTKGKIVAHYGIAPEKIEVVYNAVDGVNDLFFANRKDFGGLNEKAKMVLFLGRITLQKGPDYFLRAAKIVLDKNPDVFFVIAGSGDMEGQIIKQTVDMGIADKVIFTGFLRGEEQKRIYQMADLYVLPSVSEPFGITALEALQNGAPTLVSRQSGVSEVIKNCLKVDFWDVDQMANKILAVLNYQTLAECLQENGLQESQKFSWENSAQKCLEVYNSVLT